MLALAFAIELGRSKIGTIFLAVVWKKLVAWVEKFYETIQLINDYAWFAFNLQSKAYLG